ncbi:MAG: F0F1 ATP synthase subunit delta [Opitutales bacterium]|nr:F0F1 ATP synthase subunit delta [Opitutales bacterium]
MAETLNPTARRLAKRLALFALDAGETAEAEFGPALERVLRGRPVTFRRAFLVYLRRCLVRGLRERELLVEHAGPVDAAEVETLRTKLEATSPHSLSARLQPNDDLLGGLRLSIGDIVYDASVAGRLRALEAATAASL